MSQTTHLVRRNGVYHYRRRVPDEFVAVFGRKEIHRSLGTVSLAEAKKRRSVEDLKWDARFEAAASPANSKDPVDGPSSASKAHPLSEREVVRLVQDYVARCGERAQNRFLSDPPNSAEQRANICADIEMGLGILQNRDDPRADEMIFTTGKKILASAGKPAFESLPYTTVAEWVRRGLLELGWRRLAHAQDDYQHTFFDPVFDARQPANATFGELSDQFLAVTEEEASANGTSLKWVDKQRANVALLREMIGVEKPICSVDYDACLRVRGLLARLPANCSKLYNGLPLEQAILRAEAEAKPLLSPVTQQGYLATLREILDLAAKKRLIGVNPAEGMKPLRKDTVTAEAKRRPFTAKQLVQFFDSDFYRECTKHPVPYRHDKTGWRFWLPLMCLFMGMRPNEACQMNAADVKRTDGGTWYLDVVASSDDDESPSGATKTLKTAYSRRRIPIHPELIDIGFLRFAAERSQSGNGARLFPDLKPDEYGNCAKYALKRFRETFLSKSIAMEPRQSFYSFRHNFRDALRAINAPPDALQALGGWSQGKLVSDSYGEKSNPDYQVQFIKQIAYPGVDLNFLYAPQL